MANATRKPINMLFLGLLPVFTLALGSGTADGEVDGAVNCGTEDDIAYEWF